MHSAKRFLQSSHDPWAAFLSNNYFISYADAPNRLTKRGRHGKEHKIASAALYGRNALCSEFEAFYHSTCKLSVIVCTSLRDKYGVTARPPASEDNLVDHELYAFQSSVPPALMGDSCWLAQHSAQQDAAGSPEHSHHALARPRCPFPFQGLGEA